MNRIRTILAAILFPLFVLVWVWFLIHLYLSAYLVSLILWINPGEFAGKLRLIIIGFFELTKVVFDMLKEDITKEFTNETRSKTRTTKRR